MRVNVAVTVFAASIVTAQVPVPVHAPDHPLKIELVSGTVVSITAVPAPYVPVQVVPQDIPAGEEVIVPVPVPALEVVRAYCAPVASVLLTSFE